MDSVELIAWFRRTGVVHGGEYRRADGRPQYADRIGRPVLSAAGLVPDAPNRRNSGAQAISFDLVVDKPGLQTLAGCCGERVPEKDAPHVSHHDSRAGGVALIARNGRVQGGLGTIETGHLVVERSAKPREPFRPAKKAKKKIARSVIAQHDRRSANIDYAHSGSDVIFRHRRVGRFNVGFGVLDDTIKLLLARIDEPQDRGCGEELEGACQRKTFVSAILDKCAGRCVDYQYAEASPIPSPSYSPKIA